VLEQGAHLLQDSAPLTGFHGYVVGCSLATRANRVNRSGAPDVEIDDGLGRPS
jgi:hypothetical protein